MAIGKAKKGNNMTDKVMTSKVCAEEMLRYISKYFLDGQSFLEPCKGTGNIFDLLPENKKRCEIDLGIDFYEYEGEVDWIITNPPYSDYEKFLDKCFDVADNIALLIPLAKPFSSLGRLRKIKQYGWIKEMYIFNKGASFAGFPFGFPVAVVYIKRGYKGETNIILSDKS